MSLVIEWAKSAKVARSLTFASLLLMALPFGAHAQTSQPTPTIARASETAWSIEWQGLAGHTYFVEYSHDLQTWNFLPIIVSGSDQIINRTVEAPESPFFVRVVATDSTSPAPEAADFDGDGLNNWYEVSVSETDPLYNDYEAGLDVPSIIAKNKGGAYFRLDDGQSIFTDRSLNPSSPASLGDPVGTLIDKNQGFFAIAPSDDKRGILRVDASGNYYLDTAQAAYRVVDSTNSLLDLTSQWTHIGGYRGNGALFTNDNSGRTRVQIAAIKNYGRRDITFNSSGGVQILFANTDDPALVPHTLRIVRGPMITAFYGESDIAGAPAFEPWDDSGAVGGLALFSHRNDIVVPNYGGRWYGGVWIPGELTESETNVIRDAVTRFTVPTDLAPPSENEYALLDFAKDSFFWDGQNRQLSDLTTLGPGGYLLPYTNWWRQNHTIIVDLEVDDDAPAHSGVIVDLDSENEENERIVPASDLPDRRFAYRGADQWVFPDEHRVYRYNHAPVVRYGFVVEPGKPVKIWRNLQVMDSEPRTVNVLPPDSIAIGSKVDGSSPLTGITLHRVAFHGVAKSDTEMIALMSESDHFPIHVLGDSFTANGQFQEELSALTAPLGFIAYSNDGVGGVAFREEAGNGHADRFAQTPNFYHSTLILNDGGYEYFKGKESVQEALNDIIGRLTHSRYLYLEPNPLNPIGDRRRDEWIEGQTWITEIIGTGVHFVPTLEAMLAHHDGSPTDLTEVSKGLWPASLTGDGTHPNQSGRAIYAKAAFGALIDAGYLTGTTSTPGAPQNITAVPGDGQVQLFWELPTDDGNHPTMGHRILQETTPGSGTFTTVPGAENLKIRHFLISGLANGISHTFRVQSKNAKGWGAVAEISSTPVAD